jgi:hypothetical protein
MLKCVSKKQNAKLETDKVETPKDIAAFAQAKKVHTGS